MAQPYYRPKFEIELYAEFDEEEAALRLEEKLRKLFEDNNMQVELDSGCPTHPGQYGDH